MIKNIISTSSLTNTTIKCTLLRMKTRSVRYASACAEDGLKDANQARCLPWCLISSSERYICRTRASQCIEVILRTSCGMQRHAHHAECNGKARDDHVPCRCIPQITPAACRNHTSQFNSLLVVFVLNEIHCPLHIGINSASVNRIVDMCEKKSCTCQGNQVDHRTIRYIQVDIKAYHVDHDGERSTYGKISLQGSNGCTDKQFWTQKYGRQYVFCVDECIVIQDDAVTM